MLPVVSIGPFSIPTQPFLILLGIWIGLWVSEKQSARHGINATYLSSLVLLGLGAGALGARLGYVLRHTSAFGENPLSIFALSFQMLDLDAGLLVGGLVSLVYAQKRKMPAWPLVDALTPGLATFTIAYWMGTFASGDAYGTPSNLPWAITIWDQPRHPVQLYAVLGAGLATWLSWPRGTPPAPAGIRFLSFCAWSAAYLLIIESWRADPTPYLFGFLRSGQVFAWLLLAASLFLIGYIKRSLTISVPEE